MELQSPEIDQIAAAMVKVQAEIKPAVKDASNPFFHSKYATLEDVWDACREALKNNGVAVIQGGAIVEGSCSLVTTLTHISGQWLRGVFPLPLTTFETTEAKDGKDIKKSGVDPQILGSMIQYMRRYSLEAMVGTTRTEDDDAETAMGRGELSEDKANLKLVLENLLNSPALSAEFVDQTKAKMSQKQVASWYQARIREANAIIAKMEE